MSNRVSPKTRQRLLRHSGLGVDEAPPGRSVDDCLAEGDVSTEQFDAAMDDLIATLQCLNVELNSPIPSELVGEAEDEIPRSVAYAVAEVTRALRAAKRADEAWMIDVAWNALLAGDIDDIRTYVREEGSICPS